jgi:hypothetical protein
VRFIKAIQPSALSLISLEVNGNSYTFQHAVINAISTLKLEPILFRLMSDACRAIAGGGNSPVSHRGGPGSIYVRQSNTGTALSA